MFPFTGNPDPANWNLNFVVCRHNQVRPRRRGPPIKKKMAQWEAQIKGKEGLWVYLLDNRRGKMALGSRPALML